MCHGGKYVSKVELKQCTSSKILKLSCNVHNMNVSCPMTYAHCRISDANVILVQKKRKQITLDFKIDEYLTMNQYNVNINNIIYL